MSSQDEKAWARQSVTDEQISCMTNEQINAELKKGLLESPSAHLDKTMFPLIETWSNPIKAVEIFEVLDKCKYYSLASGFVIRVLETMLEAAMLHENVSSHELIAQAVWRNISPDNTPFVPDDIGPRGVEPKNA